MKIKRYFAANMRTAMRMVRDEQGPDAVILSNRKVDGGIEVVAAIDYDADLITKMAHEGSASERAPATSANPHHHVAAPVGAFQRYAPPVVKATASQGGGGAQMGRPIAQNRIGAAPASMARPEAAPQRSRSESISPEQFDTPAALTPLSSAPRQRAPLPDEAPMVSSHDMLAARMEKQRAAEVGRAAPASSLEWSQEPALLEMKQELLSLRKLVVNQLGGFAWGEMSQRHPLYVKLMQHLLQMGLSSELSRQLAAAVNFSESMSSNWRQAMAALAGELRVNNDDILSDGGIVALLGPTGVGKTTTIAKLAARYTLRHGTQRVALITTDCYRIGAYQQLRTYGRILGVSVHVANNDEELRQTLNLLRDKDLILIDTAGVSLDDDRLHEQTSMLQQSGYSIRNYVVLSSTTQASAQHAVVKAYSHIELTGMIMTKIDETCVLGESLSVAVKHQLPIAYICDGQRVPEDIHPARANNLVNRGVAMIQRDAELADEDLMALQFANLTQVEEMRAYG